MLTLVLLNLSILISYASSSSWYIRLWSLALGTAISLPLLFSAQSSMMSSPTSWCVLDGLNAPLITLTWWMSTLMLISSQNSVYSKKTLLTTFSWVVSVLNLVLMIMFLSNKVIFFYMFFEMSLIPTLILILGWGYQPERLQAGMYMMIYTVTASLPLLALIVATNNSHMIHGFMLKGALPHTILQLTHTTSYWDTHFLATVIFFMAMAAFFVKLPMFSLHLWLPKAHVEAPVAGSMILAAILLKLSGYGMLRIYSYLSFSVSSLMVKDLTLCFALLGGTVTSLVCFRQTDMKALIAYSSIGHMSLVLTGILSNCTWGWQAALGIMLAHGLCSAGLFSLANINYNATATRSLLLNKGMLLMSPYISMWWFLFCAANMAAPPSINLLSEILVFPAAMMNSIWLMIFLATMSFLAAGYSLFLYVSTQHGSAPKFTFPFSELNATSSLMLLLTYLPINLLIIKSDLIYSWTI
nr:NADH dehydrogenase subunit 4 [Puncturella cf. parvinobilis]